MKKWLSVLLAAVMLLAMAGIAGAVDTPTASITVSGALEGETVTAYKLVNWEYDSDNEVYKSPVWENAVQTWINSKYPNTIPGKLPAGVSEEKFYNQLAAEVNLENLTEVDLKNGQPAGMYLIMVTGGTRVHQIYIASVNVKDGKPENTSVTVGSKTSRPVLDKKVNGKDTYDTVAVNDNVTFDIYAGVPYYPEDAKNKGYMIADTMCPQLTYPGNDKVKVSIKIKGEEKELSKDAYQFITPNPGETFRIEFTYDKIKEAATNKIMSGNDVGVTTEGNKLPDAIHIQYEAVVTNKIELGQETNTNEAKLLYYNNPFVNGEYQEIPDKVKVYSYGLEVVKVDGMDTSKKLSSVGFELKQNQNALSFVKVTEAENVNNGKYVLAKDGENGKVTKLYTDEQGKIEIVGLNVGDYELVETDTIGDYNPLKEPVQIKIGTNPETPKYVTDAGNSTVKPVIEREIKNYRGMSIPSTGGMGTTIFMVAGIGVMACAVAALMLVLKRQKKNEG